MSQYDSRIFIKVKSPEIWNRFEDEGVASFRLHLLAAEGRTSFKVGYDCWSCVEDSLYEIVCDIAKQLGQDGYVIADTCNYNSDPYNACYYYFGGRVNQEEISIFNNADRCDMHSMTSISDVLGWLDYGEITLTDKEKDFLSSFGIIVSKNKGNLSCSCDSSSSDIKFEKIFLRETSFGDRPNRIEKIKISDPIELISSPDKQNDPARLAVKCLGGTIGYLPSRESEDLSSYMRKSFYTLEGRVSEVIPSSKRSKYSKSSKIAIDVKVIRKDANKEGKRNNKSVYCS